jgi:hypothetical protein
MRKRCCSNQSVTEKRTATGIQPFMRALHRVLALLLLISVPGLSTLAKIHWYLPQSNPGHYLTTATKMKVAHAPTVKTRVLQSVPRWVVSTQPESAVFSEERQETSVPRMLLTLILLRRPPPSESA